MEENKEISALFHLIDDPDEEVFNVVSTRIIDYGKGIIPNLENLWENTISEDVQERIEMLIHRLHYRDLTEELAWLVGFRYRLTGRYGLSYHGPCVPYSAYRLPKFGRV